MMNSKLSDTKIARYSSQWKPHRIFFSRKIKYLMPFFLSLLSVRLLLQRNTYANACMWASDWSGLLSANLVRCIFWVCRVDFAKIMVWTFWIARYERNVIYGFEHNKHGLSMSYNIQYTTRFLLIWFVFIICYSCCRCSTTSYRWAHFNFDYSLSLFRSCTDIPETKVKLGSSLDPNAIREGTDVYFDCLVAAHPHVYKVEWRHNVNMPVHFLKSINPTYVQTEHTAHLNLLTYTSGSKSFSQPTHPFNFLFNPSLHYI